MIRPKRFCSIVCQEKISCYFNLFNSSHKINTSSNVLNNKLKVRKRSFVINSDESEDNFRVTIKENIEPPPMKRRRNNVRNSANQVLAIHNQYVISTKTHYSLRSNRNKKCEPEHLFATPERPRKPLSEIFRKFTPIDKVSPHYQSQMSDYSNMSSNALSRFIKRKSRATIVNSIKKRKCLRIFESSFENADSSVYSSVVDENQSLSTSLQNPEMKILELCNQRGVKSWTRYFEEQPSKPVKKIGEGVYGEVFRLSKGGVLKVFPIDGDMLANNEEQMSMDDVFPEVFVSRKLTELSVKIPINNRASLLQGKLPAVLIKLWKQYKQTLTTENECLDFLPEEQKWMALEYEFAGEPLSIYKFTCYNEIRGIIEQIALSLAVAETALQFEHRDLHWQNILIKPTKQTKLNYRINKNTYFGSCNGIFVTIIDFTVSRMCVDNNIVYMDMADCPEIFEGEGDYQFDLYRMMKHDNKNNWCDFHPRSNLYWLHYLMDKLLYETSYPRGDPKSKSIELDLRSLYDRVLSYTCVQQLINNDPYFSCCQVK